MKHYLFLFLLSFNAFAADIKLRDFNWTLTDVSRRGLTKEALFSSMDRSFVKLGSSICSNRALMWANNFKQSRNLDTGKIFLYYTKKKGDISLKTWWYHVAPVINENSTQWVMDAGFPGFIDRPLSKEDWLLKFSASRNCKEMKASENELIELIFRGQTFPHQTSYGYHDCYYMVVPHTIWTPQVMAMNILGQNSNGTPVRVDRHEIVKEELYQACLEATTSKIGFALGTNKKECKAYAGIRD